MFVKIHSIEKTLFEGEVEKCIARTSLGEITVLEGHIPLVNLLEGGVRIVYQEKENDILSTKEINIPIDFGFIEVKPPKVINGKSWSEVIVLVADREASSPVSSLEIAHQVV